MMKKQVIIFPEFLSCNDFTCDNYWKDVFEKCACNKFPQNCWYDNSKNTLSIKLPIAGGKFQTEVHALTADPETNYKIMIDIFRNKLDLKSSIDLRLQKDIIEESRKSHEINLDCEWKKLKPKYLQDYMIMNYILSLKDKYSLNQREVTKLYLNIYTGFNLKKISTDDINYENGKIISIDCLTFNPDNRTFVITNDYGNSSRNEKNSTTTKVDSSIEKFIKEYKMRRLKN